MVALITKQQNNEDMVIKDDQQKKSEIYQSEGGMKSNSMAN